MSIEQHLKKKGHVNPAWASRFQSDRFLNSNEMICFPESRFDILGREAVPSTLMRKTAGCDTSSDRILVENEQRPKGYSTLGLSGYGISGVDMCDSEKKPTAAGALASRYQTITDDTRTLPDEDQYMRHRTTVDAQWITLGNKDLYYKSLSGCL